MNTRTVRRPNLTPDEKTKRMNAIKEAAIQLIIATEKAKALKGGANG